MRRVRVEPGTQVNLTGTIYGGGELVEAPDDIAEAWITAGWVEPAAPPRKASASKSASKAAPKKAAG